MLVFYNLAIKAYVVLIRISSIFGNSKAHKWIEGRKNIFSEIESKLQPGERRVWFHFASLGEFEQGRPLLEKLRATNHEVKLVITFFSPSGYEVQKNYKYADYVFYLPLDTAANARKFLGLLNPELVFFTKYEYWYHYFFELKRRATPLYVFSAIFRPEQVFFRWYGSLHRKMLHCVTHFFVQNEASRQLLLSLNLNNVTISGDTRFDRVTANTTAVKSYPLIESFCENNAVCIAGSTWPEDEKLLVRLINEGNTGMKFIIAPHEIREEKILALISSISSDVPVCRYSRMAECTDMHNCKALIIDNIGLLSSLYQYGTIAYIGGGFGKGIHNILEAAAFGLPVIFGINYQKFKEARDMISNGGAFTVSSFDEFSLVLARLQDEGFRKKCSEIGADYVRKNTGATEKILNAVGIR